MERLTARRTNVIKSGYWSGAKKDELMWNECEVIGNIFDTPPETVEQQ